MDHTSHAVLAQADVDHTTNKIARFRPLLDRLDLAATVVTADALHIQREHADWLVTAKHAAYLLIVKATQPACTTSSRSHPGQTSPHLASRRWRTVTVYAVTSLTTTKAAPWQLAGHVRGHWTIENQLHRCGT
jgi:predicted transposase YbfD/YdcC